MLKNAATQQTRIYTPDESAFPNAQIGYAPMTDSAYAQDSLLRYVELRWREVEPQEGVYAWDALDAQYGFRDLRARGIHLVVRFVCDGAGAGEPHGHPGLGSTPRPAMAAGTAPITARAIPRITTMPRSGPPTAGCLPPWASTLAPTALSPMWSWGAWATGASGTSRPGRGWLPMARTRPPGPNTSRTMRPRSPRQSCSWRRPFNITAAHDLGVYNDMTGHGEDTAEWLGWLQNGGWYGEEPNALAPMPAFWQNAPVGGEFTSSIPMKTMLRSQLSQTVELVQQSHMSFLGPKVAEETYRGGYNAVLKNLGYRLRVTQLTLTPGPGGTTVTLTIRNDGNAPFYWDWSTNLYLEDAAGNPLRTLPLGLSLPELLPGQEQAVSVTLEGVRLSLSGKNGGQRLTLGIVDPMTGRDAVRFAMKTKIRNGRAVLI